MPWFLSMKCFTYRLPFRVPFDFYFTWNLFDLFLDLLWSATGSPFDIDEIIIKQNNTITLYLNAILTDKIALIVRRYWLLYCALCQFQVLCGCNMKIYKCDLYVTHINYSPVYLLTPNLWILIGLGLRCISRNTTLLSLR